MDRPKRQIFVDTFPCEVPRTPKGRPRKSTKPTKSRRVTCKTTKATRKTAAPPARKPKARVEPTPEQFEAQKQVIRERDRKRAQTPERKEALRLGAQARRREAVRLGLCVTCREPAIPEQTRCSDCAEIHRVKRRRWQNQRNQKLRNQGQTTSL